ncbi:hypothetical protein CRUP_036156 [Coryphaenoides rupestris]|nr:hypothetical protein CRUP_036156 [Coryphaenoides rupestris]
MSWFTDLAGKAEDFLNKVDQGAATALQKDGTEYPTDGGGSAMMGQQSYESSSHHHHNTHSFISAAAGNIKRSNTTTTTPLGSSSPSSASNTARASSGFVRRKKSLQDVDDDMLFDFLNSSDPPASSLLHRWRPEGDEARSAQGLPPSASTPNLAPAPTPVFGGAALASGTSTPHSSRGISRTSSLGSLSTHSGEPSQPEPLFPDESQSQELSSLRLENQLLRNEWNSDQSQTDRVVREFRAQVDDLTEALSAKDGQLAVLKIRLDEADQLLKSRNSALEEAQNEKSRMLQDQSEGSNMQSQALGTLQQRLREAELSLRLEQDSYRQMQGESAARLSRVEGERQALAEAVTGAERRVAEERRRADDLQQQSRSARSAAEAAKQELQDYKHKASRILQSKEKLISSLKEGSGLDGLDSGRGAAMELEELRHDKELHREEVQRLQGQVLSLRSEVQELESQAVSEELQYVEEEGRRTTTSLQSRIKDRDDEIQKLRNQLTNKALSSSSQAELESRLHQLTETLIQKQTMLEALGTEKSSLVFQLERMEQQQQLKSAAQGGSPGSGQVINMGALGLEGPGAAPPWNSDQSQTDRVVREFRAQVDDLTEALSAKDGQLAVLKIRLDEADQLLKSRNSALEEAQNEKSRMLQDQSEGSNMQSQALETLQQRLREAELSLRLEQDSYRQMQGESAARLSRVEGERQALAEAVTGAERRVAEERRRADDLQQQSRSARSAAEAAKQELQDYKHKASRILQSKEKLISSLKEGSGLDGLDSGRGAAMELEELRHDKELHREEVQRLQGQVLSLRSEVQELESQAVSEELQYVEEEGRRTTTSLQSRIKDRDDEIQKLRNQLTNKALSSSSQAELESRLHQLTETLIQKQTMLEALGTEKSSLVFQLERMEQQQQLKSAAQGGSPGSGQVINMGALGLEGPGARQRSAGPVLFSDQYSPGVYGQVRKAASTIDRFSIRLGIFLRRYPIARVFVILYIGLLHLWVMIVLLTYTPEMHHDPPGGR